eukprot:CAMPEP_0178385566 /NCGR_PEP_ID=MMETSP0689_2-20121128/8097_1 /TAXON_ID=160604 /ORGANISM="Amphidinium massartii, Strain CS-259" /LENGTH=73 /DNA_ID=CAMNT_0020005849 /DNA_START=407 /DNA_END=625 /DNA_ORIENTATION=-
MKRKPRTSCDNPAAGVAAWAAGAAAGISSGGGKLSCLLAAPFTAFDSFQLPSGTGALPGKAGLKFPPPSCSRR